MPPPPGVRRARTRAAVLAAALDVFAERGYAGSSVEDIAQRAGYTRGAVYSSFGGREEIVLALLDERAAAQLERMTALLASAGLDDSVGAAGGMAGGTAAVARAVDAIGEVTDDDRRWFLVSTEFSLLATRDAEVGRRLADHDAAIREAAAVFLGRLLAALGREPRTSLTDLATVVIALREGLMLQSVVDPGRVPPGVLARQVLPLLLEGMSRG